MLKLNKDTSVNEELIECISGYETSAVRNIASRAKKNGTYRTFDHIYGIKTMVLLQDGYVYLCPYCPETYFSRLNEPGKYIAGDTKKSYIREDLIREIVSAEATTKQQKDAIRTAKMTDNFVNLCGKIPVKYYAFTTTGRVYAIKKLVQNPESEE